MFQKHSNKLYINLLTYYNPLRIISQIIEKSLYRLFFFSPLMRPLLLSQYRMVRWFSLHLHNPQKLHFHIQR